MPQTWGTEIIINTSQKPTTSAQTPTGFSAHDLWGNSMRERTRRPTHPGGILMRQYLRPLDIGISQAALALGISRKTLSKILHERGAVTPEMALRLAQTFQTTPELWLNLQRAYDLWEAAHTSEAWREAKALVEA